METDKRLSLIEVLSVLENNVINSKPTIFVTSDDKLETFFKYKGNLIDLFELKVNLAMQKLDQKEVENKITGSLVNGIQKGYWNVFHLGKNADLSVKNIFKQFSFYQDDFFYNDKILDKNFLKSSGILKDEEDVDFFGNKGYYTVHKDSKVIYLIEIGENTLEDFKKKNQDIKFEYVIVN